MDTNIAQAFAEDVRKNVEVLVRSGLKNVQARQDAMFERLKGANTRGMTFPTSSFSVSAMPYAVHDGVAYEFHLNIPSELASDEMVGRIDDIVGELSEQYGIVLDVGEKVKGGSNFVLEGRLVDAPAPIPGM